jgi:hypothetical protein
LNRRQHAYESERDDTAQEISAVYEPDDPPAVAIRSDPSPPCTVAVHSSAADAALREYLRNLATALASAIRKEDAP